MNKRFLLFASCIPVRGVTQSTICDLHRNKFYLIPNSLYDVIKEYQGETLDYVKSMYDNKYDDEIDDYFAFLESNELVFFTKNIEKFPQLNTQWDEPFHIANAIIDVTERIEFVFHFLDELKTIGCNSLQIRFFKDISLIELNNILSYIEKGRISSVEIIIGYNELFNNSIEAIEKIIDNHKRISIYTIYSSPNKEHYHLGAGRFGHVFYTTDSINSEKCCGKIDPCFFTINFKTFTESLHFNSCLNRKISVDSRGNIKNCPSMLKSFGNIANTSVKEILKSKEFKKNWNITKDKIHVCKDCEFRYICTDCRAYVENPQDIYSKPLKCGYNPYTGKWVEWNKNPLKQKTIEYYGMNEMYAGSQESLSSKSNYE